MTDPADFEHVCSVEDQLRAGRGRFASRVQGQITLSYTGTPLRQLITAQAKPEQTTLFDVCDEGHCWT